MGEPPDPGGGSETLLTAPLQENPEAMDTSIPKPSRKRPPVEDSCNISKKTSTVDNTIAITSTTPTTSLSCFIHPTLLEKKVYNSADKGPFIVHVSRIEPDPSAGLTIRPIKFGKFLFLNNIKNIINDGVKPVGRNRIAIHFNSYLDANDFINNKALKDNNYSAVVPTFNVTRMGVVRDVPTEWSMEEFVDSVKVPEGCGYILKARRFNRKVTNDGSTAYLPTQSVVLTFSGQCLPPRVYSFHTSLKVTLYELPTIQCNACCRFGHVKSQCRSKPRCFRCGMEHSGDSCQVTSPTCISCSGKHVATDKNCPEHNRQKSIKTVMAQENISYIEASQRFPGVRRSFADVLFSSPPAPVPSLSQPHNNTRKWTKKTISSPNKPHKSSSENGFDKRAHNDIIRNPVSTSPNGCALINNHHNEITPDDNLLEVLISALVNILTKYESLPNPVVKKIKNLTKLMHYGSESDSSVEL